MISRPRLITSIPFWILLVASLAAIGVGMWIALTRLGEMETALTSGTATGIEVYVGQPWAVIGGAIAAAGVVGLFLTLATAAVATILPRPAVEVVEAIDWDSEEESASEADVAASAPAATSTPAPAAGTAAAGTPAAASTAAGAPAAASTAAGTADPASELVSEDPDVETPSDAPAPMRAEDGTVSR